MAVAVLSPLVITSSVPPQPVSADGDDLSDLNKRVEILRRQREAAHRLAARCLAELANVRNDLDVVNSSITHNCAVLTRVRGENNRLLVEVGRLSSGIASA